MYPQKKINGGKRGKNKQEEDRKKKSTQVCVLTQLVGNFWGRKNTFNLLSTHYYSYYSTRNVGLDVIHTIVQD